LQSLLNTAEEDDSTRRTIVMTRLLDRPRLGIYADWFAVAIAIVLPWSTTFTYVFIVLWLIALVASWKSYGRKLVTA
jgi:hypothetical protein